MNERTTIVVLHLFPRIVHEAYVSSWNRCDANIAEPEQVLVSENKRLSNDAESYVGIYLEIEIEVAGFEPTTPWSQTRCASQTAPHLESHTILYQHDSTRNRKTAKKYIVCIL